MTDLSLAEIRAHIAALDRFRERYTAYLNTGPGNAPSRRPVIEVIPAADLAMDASGMSFHFDEAMGQHRKRYSGLVNTAFVHEYPGWTPSGPSDQPATYEQVLSNVGIGRARLIDLEAEVRRARRRPTYWIRRALRALLAPSDRF